MLRGHDIDTVAGRGWVGLKNSDLLGTIRGHCDVFITMDRGIEFQQNIEALPFGVLVVRAPSNRMEHLKPLVPLILDGIARSTPGQLQQIGD